MCNVLGVVDYRNVMTLYYEPKINRFTDEFGSVVHDIFRLITPGQLMIFKEAKNIYVVPDRSRSFLVEMIYPEESEEYLEY